VESFELVSQTNKSKFFRQVLFHPKANEIVKIFGFLRTFRVNFQAANFPKLFELIIASPNPYVTCCLIGNFQKLNLLPYWFGFNVSQLVYQTNAQELSICLSNNYDFLVEMTEMDSLCLIILCAKKDEPSQVIELFKFLLLNLPDIYPVDVIQIMQKRPEFSHPIKLLKKIQRHQILTIHLVDTIFSHPKSDDLLALISFYEKYFTLNEELLGRILSEEHPLAIAKFLNLADTFSLCKPSFFEEFSRVKDIIFYSPAVVDRFLRIRKEYFLEINLKQFLILF